MKSLLSGISPLWPRVVSLFTGSLLISFTIFGLFLPRRLEDAALHGYVGSVVIATCHLSALAVPAVLMLMRPTWWSRLLLLLAVLLLFFEACVYRITDTTAGYYDYLHLANAAGSISNAASEYGADALRAALSIMGLVIVFAGIRGWGEKAGSRTWASFCVHSLPGPGILVLLLSIATTSGFSLALYFRGHMATRGLAPGYGLPVSLMLSAVDDAFREPPPVSKEVSTRPGGARHILFIIDESVQFDVLRELWMETPQSRVLGPPLPMLSYANSSAASNSMLRHACDPRWPDRALKGKGILGKAKAAGYRIVYYDNQAVLRRGDNYFGPDEIGCVDKYRPGDTDDIHLDVNSLPELVSDLQADTEPTFILMNKRGSHFAYVDNFRPDEARPGEPAYYTSVRVNSVVFLQRLVDSGVLAHTALYFTSDHGQDWEKKVPHGTSDPLLAHRSQWEVPSFVMHPGSTPWAGRLPPDFWLSHFHLAEALNNELGFDNVEMPALEQALDSDCLLNGDHEGLFVFPFKILGHHPSRMTLKRTRAPVP